ncbi:TorD/DmsD family molecular chaperone [Salmonella bongori]|uniref:TorD/DmsD family molecular chaperone n=1 Tax=Salmonella bongori TaxID=54736 RepID=UPI0009A96A59|nr:molecular chaperone TorD family protein [Salmonella bongori]EGE4654117.1 molecular chaperone [Salmonella bongori serovar 40:z35:- str. 95-0123]QVP36339.1 molecular chaperone TorD family protein [Salmonella bongori serovar 40:z35:-]
MDSIYEYLTELESSGLLLRDFFISSDSQTLKSAYLALNKEAAELSDSDWLAAEYDFNALFVGPGKLKAAPYASVYLEEDALVMGKSTLSLREFMEDLGLSINKKNNTPDDHISYVLELAVLLLVNARKSPEYIEMLTRYVNYYITEWVPEYIEKIKINAQTAPLRKVGEKLSYWLDELITSVQL